MDVQYQSCINLQEWTQSRCVSYDMHFLRPIVFVPFPLEKDQIKRVKPTILFHSIAGRQFGKKVYVRHGRKENRRLCSFSRGELARGAIEKREKGRKTGNMVGD